MTGARSGAGDALAAFAAEVGPTTAGPVTVAGGGTHREVGRLAPGDAPTGAAAAGADGFDEREVREVRAPAGIVAVEAADMTVTVLAGTTVADLDAALAEVRQTVALPDRPGATVGGVLAVGRSGVRHLGWGPVRDALLQVRYVSAEGDVVTAGGPTVKNVSGFDLCRLLVGSLGTLGLLAEVVLRTRPLPVAERWVTGQVDPFVLVRALHRPASVLWDGTTTWALLDGHPDDVAAETVALGLVDAPGGPPPLPPHRWSLRPGELRQLPGRGAAGLGSFVAQVGVGVVHADVPPPGRPVDPAVVALNRRIKALFDPTRRLNPACDPLAA